MQIGIRSETQEKQWAPAVPFDAASLPLPEEPDADGAKRIFDRIKAEGLTGETLTFNEEGVATASPLAEGLYLFRQEEPAEGYEPFEPFPIAVPSLSDGMPLYETDASLKLQIATEVQTSSDEEEPAIPSDENEKLPLTGQLWWPAGVLAAAGAAAVAFGLCKKRRSGRE